MWNMKKECIFHKCKCKIVRVCVCVCLCMSVGGWMWMYRHVEANKGRRTQLQDTQRCVCTLNQTNLKFQTLKFGSFRFFPPLVLIGCRCIANKATAVIMVLDHQAPVSLTQSQFKWVLLVLQLQQGSGGGHRPTRVVETSALRRGTMLWPLTIRSNFGATLEHQHSNTACSPSVTEQVRLAIKCKLFLIIRQKNMLMSSVTQSSLNLSGLKQKFLNKEWRRFCTTAINLQNWFFYKNRTRDLPIDSCLLRKDEPLCSAQTDSG